jgi:hypothetical protein
MAQIATPIVGAEQLTPKVLAISLVVALAFALLAHIKLQQARSPM